MQPDDYDHDKHSDPMVADGEPTVTDLISASLTVMTVVAESRFGGITVWRTVHNDVDGTVPEHAERLVRAWESDAWVSVTVDVSEFAPIPF